MGWVFTLTPAKCVFTSSKKQSYELILQILKKIFLPFGKNAFCHKKLQKTMHGKIKFALIAFFRRQNQFKVVLEDLKRGLP